MKKYDLIVLGGGSGGIASANRAGMYGANVAVIEGKDLGGTCVNRGCVPKKIGWYASQIAEASQILGPEYGFDIKVAGFDYEKFRTSRDAYIQRSRDSYLNQFEKNGVEYISAYGQFVDDHTIEADGELYQADHIIIATGGRPAPLDLPGSDLLENSDDIFEWNQLPKSIAFLGAGYVAVELAQMYQALGVETHLVIRHDRPLRSFDQMLSDNLVKHMEASNLHLHKNLSFDSFQASPDGRIDCLKDGQVLLTVEKVVAAVGRVPNTENLGLDKTSIELDDQGFIKIDDSHQTTAKGVYAVGDVSGKIALTPVAIRAGRQVAEFLFNQAESSAIDYQNIPTVIFAHPAIGTIGYSESEAKEKFGSDQIKVYQSRFFSMYHSAGNHRQACDFKLVCLGEEEKVIGMHGIGYGVDEMIQGFGVAIKMGATKSQWDAIIAIHPTGSEEFVTMR